MSNRHKSQASQSGAGDLDKIDTFSQEGKFKRSAVMPVSEDRSFSHVNQNNNMTPGIMRSNSVPNALNENEEEIGTRMESAEITFKMSKNRNGFQNDSYKEED